MILIRTLGSCRTGVTMKGPPFTPSPSSPTPSSRYWPSNTVQFHQLFLQDVPSIFEEGVLGVSPGEAAPTEGDWTTLFFLPGIHDIGLNFRLHSNRFPFATLCFKEIFDRSYYIPGDAIVYGTMNNGGKSEHRKDNDGDNIRCFSRVHIV